MLSLSPKGYVNLDEFYNTITVSKRISAHLTIYSFALGLDDVKSDNSIMANVKSDEVKQSMDNLETYSLFIEDKLKLFMHKEFDQCGSLLSKIMLEGEMYHLLAQLPLTVEERNNLVVYSGSFFVVQSWSGLHQMLIDFWYYSVGLILGSYIFHGLNTLRKL